ncbi:aminodeoxychorismate/anthranilate synthase component II [bacterium]|nr:aminodeoxychorismate/anthranilate synthase component II [bacterium]
MRKILLIDNYDSFTYNLYYLIQSNYWGKVQVIRNDEILISEVVQYEAIVISPGPGTPADSGFTLQILSKYHKVKPILGICLGMQCINEFFGGDTIKAPFPVHGKQQEIFLNKPGLIMTKIQSPIKVARYHSLMISNVPSDLMITAHTWDKIPMVIEHKTLPIYGIQFHPESFLTPQGDRMIKNFLEIVEKECR